MNTKELARQELLEQLAKSLPERMARRKQSYAEESQAFYEALEKQGINTSAKNVIQQPEFKLRNWLKLKKEKKVIK